MTKGNRGVVGFLAWVLAIQVPQLGAVQLPRVGVTAGVTIGDAAGGGSTADVTSRTGLVMGATATIPLSPRFNLVSGLRFAQKRFADPLDPLVLPVCEGPVPAIVACSTLGLDLAMVYRMTYLEAPLLVQYRLPVMPGLSLGAGPSVGVRIGCSIATGGVEVGQGCNPSSILALCADSPCEGPHRFDYGFVLGVGYDFRFVQLNAAWERSLRPLGPGEAFALGRQTDAKQSTLLLTVDYPLGLP